MVNEKNNRQKREFETQTQNILMYVKKHVLHADVQFLVKFWLNLNWRKKTLQTNSLKVDDQYGSTVLSKRIQKVFKF